jgi:hypothetical protein
MPLAVTDTTRDRSLEGLIMQELCVGQSSQQEI